MKAVETREVLVDKVIVMTVRGDPARMLREIARDQRMHQDLALMEDAVVAKSPRRRKELETEKLTEETRGGHLFESEQERRAEAPKLVAAEEV